MARYDASGLAIDELREFASFAACEQRYIRRSLDIALNRSDPVKRWARDEDEASSIRAQLFAYRDLEIVRKILGTVDGLDNLQPFMAQIMHQTAFDLAQGRLEGFCAYRFLYERLFGAEVRPWLPAAFCGAAALPIIVPEKRRVLLQSISEAAATAHGWSTRAPSFYPEFVEAEAA